ncbi:MAG: DUF4340 domain-containing protein [Ruminococcaceae bacterium]|nr:DUF4340 domain-containing protein [Oscillospiraceae bacterium]
MIKKQTLTIIICTVLVAILIPVYFLFVAPLLKTETVEDEPPILLPGEVLGANNRILMFEHVQKADIDKIEVHNEHGSYTFKREKDNFYVDGMEAAPYNLELFSSLVVSAGYTLSMMRLDEMNEDLSTYGLGEADNPAWYVLTKMDGTQHKVYIGKMIPTGGGYYCMYEGRKAVYILDTSLAATLLADVHSLLTPSLGYPVSSALYTKVKEIQVIKNEELLVWIETIIPENPGEGEALMTYEFKHPKGYSPNTTTISTMLQVFGSFAGSEVVLAGNETSELDAKILKEQYGIDVDHPYFLVSYTVTDNDVDIETIVAFSEPDEDGVMYAYSTVFNLVAKIHTSAIPFVSWGLINYVDYTLFKENINDVAKLEIQGEIKNGEENLKIDAAFVLDGEKETIRIYPNGRKDPYDADDLKNFRQLYIVLVSLSLENYVDDVAKRDLLATVTATLDSGEVLEYQFFSYSTTRCYYTINGKGEFYLLRSQVEKLLRDTDRLLQGLPIDAYAKN